MNQDLLRHFQPCSDAERYYLDVLNETGKPFTGTNPFIRSAAHLKDGMQIAINRQSRFVHHAQHKHDFVEMIYACAGQSSHLVNGNGVTLQTGELLLLNEWSMHENLPPGEHDITINFIILPQFFELTLGMMGDTESSLRKFLLNCLYGRDQQDSYLHFKAAEILPIQNLLENLIWSLVNDMQYRHNINQHTMGLLFLHLLGHADKVNSGSKRDELIFKILQYIDEHYADGTLDALAKRLDYNMEWMSRNIKRLTGSTFTQLQQNKRISQAKILLRTTNLTVTEIAKQVGYSNTSYFHRLFHEQEGCTPKEYQG